MSKLSFFFFIPLLIIPGCADVLVEDKSGVDVKSVSFTADSFVYDGMTKSVVDPSNGNFTWAADDTVGIYPTSGSQIYFAMINGAGTNTATFDGGGWAFKSGASYVSYYPFIADFYLDRTKIPVSFVNQRQDGPDNFSHFGKFDYMYTKPTEVINNSLSFNYKHLICVLQVNATLPAGTYKQLTLSAADAVFVEKGHFSLDDENPAIVGDKFSKELSIVLDNITLTEMKKISIYIVSAPLDLSGKTMTVSVIDSDKKQLDCIKNIPPSYPFRAFNFYPFGCSSWTEVPQSVGLVINDWGDGGSISGGAE